MKQLGYCMDAIYVLKTHKAPFELNEITLSELLKGQNRILVRKILI